MKKLVSTLLILNALPFVLFAQTESISHDMNGQRVFHQTDDSTSIQAQHMNWGKAANNISTGIYSTTWGADNEASGNQATAWGINNEASSFNTTAFGNNTTASGSHATSWGAFTIASGAYSTASGSENTVSGGFSMGWGRKNTLSSSLGAVWGDENTVGWTYGTAWGFQNNLQAHFATSWGKNNIVQGQLGSSWGYRNTVSGDSSTVWGSRNVASGLHNTIWGQINSSTGAHNTVWGYSNDATADYNSVWGRHNTSAGDVGTVWGENVTGNAFLNTVFGRYNVARQGTASGWKDTETLLAIGNGNEDEGRDGMIMLKNGNIGLNFMQRDGLPSEILDVNGNIHSTQHVKANQLLANRKIGVGTMNPTEEMEILNTLDSSHVVIKSNTSVSVLEMDGATQSTIKMLDNGTVNAEMRWAGNSFDLYSSPPVEFPLIRSPTIKMTTDNYVGIRKGLLMPTEALDVNGRIKLGDGSNFASAGVMRYNQAASSFEGFNGTSWNAFDGLPIDDDGDSRLDFAEAATDSIKFIVNGNEQMSFNGHSLDLGKNGNTFIGHQSARQEFSSNTGNTSLGWLATPFVLNGIENTYLGNSAGHDLTTGDYNTVVGASALFDNQNGARNTAVGYKAGKRNSGTGNVFLGYLAGFSEVGDNKLYIENSTNPNPLIYGDFEKDSLAFNADVEVNGELHVPNFVNPQGLRRNVVAMPDGRIWIESIPKAIYHATDFSDWIGMVSDIRHVKDITNDFRNGTIFRSIALKYTRWNPNIPNLKIYFIARNLNTGAFTTLYTIEENNLPNFVAQAEYFFTPIVMDKDNFSYFLASVYEAPQIVEIEMK